MGSQAYLKNLALVLLSWKAPFQLMTPGRSRQFVEDTKVLHRHLQSSNYHYVSILFLKQHILYWTHWPHSLLSFASYPKFSSCMQGRKFVNTWENPIRLICCRKPTYTMKRKVIKPFLFYGQLCRVSSCLFIYVN